MYCFRSLSTARTMAAMLDNCLMTVRLRIASGATS